MNRTIRTLVLALPVALALSLGAGAAHAAVQPIPDPAAPVPWAPFEQPEPEDDEPFDPVAPVPWAPFELDTGDEEPEEPAGPAEPEAPQPQDEPGTEADDTAAEDEGAEETTEVLGVGEAQGMPALVWILVAAAALLAGVGVTAGFVGLASARRSRS